MQVNVPKPRWLPDLGRPKRCAVLDEFFNISDGATRPTISREATAVAPCNARYPLPAGCCPPLCRILTTNSPPSHASHGSVQLYEQLLAPDFRFTDQSREGQNQVHQYFRADFIELMCNSVAPALPDFSWSAATDGEVDRDGYCIVEVQISAHHTGAPFALPSLPEVAPSGRRVAMEPEFLRVRVEAEQVKEIVVLPSKAGAGPLALYRALANEPPAAA
ncbi:hypothetical protein COHA_004103 [Chlorella ohadii]|uniref:Uncharacterized protein n=1 Tax=Chlorella ohadii TaxID=2649997 RepID=A0AAD5DU83_9CHLO|nr:hypothetical protein COHA_004103 [Chlorella ohadii]